MKTKSLNLLIEINNFDFIFVVVEKIDDNNSKIVFKENIPIQGIKDNLIIDYNLILKIFKEKIYSLEQNLDFIFKEAIIIIDNFNYSLISFSGFKKLNGSQLLKENITYILNFLKSQINEIENKKTILHIFNTKFTLDDKEMVNLPIGLFGNFYYHELSFFLLDNNDYNNLKKVLSECNLKIKKIVSKNFVEGATLIKSDTNLNNLFKIEISEEYSKLTFIENSSLKYIQDFKFGSNLIINDISKITGLKADIIKNILVNSDFSENNLKELVEKNFFKDNNYRKISKKLIKDIANARIEELSEIILLKNINTKFFLEKKIPIFLKIKDPLILQKFINSFKLFFSNKYNCSLSFIDNDETENFYNNANDIVQFGWKKEAVPIILEKRSILARLFNFLFN